MFFIIEKATGIKKSVYRRGRGHVKMWGSKSAVTRIMNKEDLHETHDVVPTNEYKPRMVKRVNIMTGEEYEEDINTPACCSPACETYWSM